MEYKYRYTHTNGTRVYVNEKGQKKLIYDGKEFKTFKEIEHYRINKPPSENIKKMYNLHNI